MRSLSLLSAIVWACAVEFALPYYPLLDDVFSEDYDASSSSASSQADPAKPQLEAVVSPDPSIEAPLAIANVQRSLNQREDNNVFRRGMGDGRNSEQQGASTSDSLSTTNGIGGRMSSMGKGKGGMMMSSGKGMMMGSSGKGRMTPPPILPPIPPGKGKGSGGEGCWVTIGGDGWGGSSKSKKGSSKGLWWDWATVWGPHKVWDPECRIPCYDDSSSKSKSKKAKGKGKGKGGSSKSIPHCPMMKPTPIIPTPSAPSSMMMVPTRQPTRVTPTRKPTTLTRAPAPTGTRRPTLAPTAETLAPVPTVTNRTNTTTLAPVLANTTNTSAPARR